MKIFKKESKVNQVAPKKALDKKIEETPAVKANDASVTLSEDEIAALKELLPVLTETVPKLLALLNGEAEIEIVQDGEADAPLEDDSLSEDLEDLDANGEGVSEEDVEDVEIIESDEDDKAEDAKVEESATTKVEEPTEPKAEDKFDIEALLKDPEKRAEIEAALGKKATDADEAPKASKKVFVKKTLPKKAGDSVDKNPVKPNAELIQTLKESKKSLDSKEPQIRKFDFHKRGR